MGYIDLHMHSAHSDDGEFPVLELIRQAEESQLKLAAIADHDNIQAAREIEKYRGFSSVKWLKGVELSVRHGETDLHLLAYDFNLDHPWFETHRLALRKAEEDATAERIAKINEHFKLNLKQEDLEVMAKGRIITGELIAEAILEDTENKKNPLLKPYFKGGQRASSPLINFYWDTMAQGKFAYVKTYLPTFSEALNEIHKAGGLAVLAHPGQSVKENQGILTELIHLGLDGIECYSSYHSEMQNAFYVGLASKRNLLITCGSDYHGKTKPHIRMGQGSCPVNVDEMLKQLEKRGVRL